MGTRCTISVVNEDSTVSKIYCQFDGYFRHNGKILLQNYNTYETVQELMDLGDLSCLGKMIGEKHSFHQRTSMYDNFRNYCFSYIRDGGEKECEKETYPSEEYFLENRDEFCQSRYNYLFKKNEEGIYCWYNFENADSPLLLLTNEMCGIFEEELG